MRERFAETGKETMENTVWMHSPQNLNMMLEFFNSVNNVQPGNN